MTKPVDGASGHHWRFGDCEFDERRRELRVRGTAVDIESKPLEVLHQLLLHAGEVVTKEELLESVWPGLMVVDGSLATAMSKLRKALGDDGVVVTLPRVGYRLGVQVRSQPVAPPAWSELHLTPDAPVPARPQWRLTRRLDLSPSSEVWLAEHAKTRELRVFKFAPDGVRLKSLKREVTLARLLRESLGQRPEFVRVLEWNFENPPYFLESAYAGPNLAEWAEIQGGLGNIALDVRLGVLVDVARAVSTAHALDVLHKDLKPGNILVSDGPSGEPQIKIADFGSASLLAPARLSELAITNLGFTQTGSADQGALTGTVMYLAPEVVAGHSPSPAGDVYALGVLLYQLVIGDFRKPLAPGWEADVADPLIREDIASAACGDPARRFTTATELVERLINLDRRRVEHEELSKAQHRAQVAERRRTESRVRRPWLVVAGVAVMAAAGVSLYFYRSASSLVQNVRTVAVLPFQNVGADPRIDYLRLALPDEVATLLSHVRGLGVRPFATTSKYDRAGVDVQQAGRQMHVGSVVTGHFSSSGQQLHITLEAIDVESNRLLWRAKIDAPIDSMIATQVQIALRVKGGLAPVFGASAADASAQPTNEEAYQLFLRSAALTFDPTPNPQGIAMLEQAVALDSTYPPAWLALARRYYVEARYATGNEALMARYDAAIQRAASLDANYVPASAGLVARQVEQGDLIKAYENAADLVRRRPDSADAHFSLSYVLRFAGLLDDSARHCDSAFVIEAQTQTSGLRSCAIVFILRGDYPRAMNYLQLDLGSDFSKALSVYLLVRQGRLREALQIGPPHIPQWKSYELLLACAEQRPPAEIEALAHAVRPSEDPEMNFIAAAHLAYCHQTDAALEMLQRAIKGSYCSYPVIESDPFFAELRAKPEFAEIRRVARECQSTFLAQRAHPQ